MPALTPKQVSLHLKTALHWSKHAQTIFRAFKFEDFLNSIDFVNRVARIAQKLNHHPDIDIRLNKVALKLSTHDEGGLTEKDFPWPGNAMRSSPGFLGRDQRSFASNPR